MCYNPIRLKSGNVVPCGHCLECLSKRRNEWSIRLQKHSEQFDFPPLFVTLTYDYEHLVFGDIATLCKSDVMKFCKSLHNRFDNISYFGCGEYGSKTFRPHYHIIIFGADRLVKMYNDDVHKCENYIASFWNKGIVDVGICKMSGIHYVTKYTLKSNDDLDGAQKTFNFCSKGLGANWFDSKECKTIRKKLVNMCNIHGVFPEIDFTSINSVISSCKSILRILKPLVANLKITLLDGSQYPLPRFYRKRLIGHFDKWSDNPFAFYNHVSNVLQTAEYFKNHGYKDSQGNEYCNQQNRMKEYILNNRFKLKEENETI